MKLHEITGQVKYTRSLQQQRDGLKQGYQKLKDNRGLYTADVWAEIEQFMDEEIRKIEYLIGRDIAFNDAIGVVK